ncbi:hypothetical protein C3Y90_10715 [Rhizobium sp. UPM1134]|nr:hypothetical protein [Rhizobium ruizarguesonis]
MPVLQPDEAVANYPLLHIYAFPVTLVPILASDVQYLFHFIRRVTSRKLENNRINSHFIKLLP